MFHLNKPRRQMILRGQPVEPIDPAITKLAREALRCGEIKKPMEYLEFMNDIIHNLEKIVGARIQHHAITQYLAYRFKNLITTNGSLDGVGQVVIEMAQL